MKRILLTLSIILAALVLMAAVVWGQEGAPEVVITSPADDPVNQGGSSVGGGEQGAQGNMDDLVEPDPQATKDTAKDPVNQDKAPVGGGQNLPSTGMKVEKDPALEKPNYTAPKTKSTKKVTVDENRPDYSPTPADGAYEADKEPAL